MTYEVSRESKYYNILQIEVLVGKQIDRIMEFGSKKLFEYYEESVDRLIDLLPPEIEDSILTFKNNNDIHYDISVDGKEKYVRLFREIKKQLSTCNIVWRQSNTPVGHD